MHGAPDDGGHAEAVEDVHGAQGHGGNVMRHHAGHLAVRRQLGHDLHAHVGLAFVVQHHELVVILAVGILISFLHGKISRVSAAHAERAQSAGKRSHKTHFNRFLGIGRRKLTPGHNQKTGAKAKQGTFEKRNTVHIAMSFFVRSA